MPYLLEGRKKELTVEPQRAETDGDYNFLFTRAYLKRFISDPSYATIALIRKAALHPPVLKTVDDIECMLYDKKVPWLDREVARSLAFTEFYDRIGKRYEELAAVKNGDLVEYEQAFLAMIEKFKIPGVEYGKRIGTPS